MFSVLYEPSGSLAFRQLRHSYTEQSCSLVVQEQALTTSTTTTCAHVTSPKTYRNLSSEKEDLLLEACKKMEKIEVHDLNVSSHSERSLDIHGVMFIEAGLGEAS